MKLKREQWLQFLETRQKELQVTDFSELTDQWNSELEKFILSLSAGYMSNSEMSMRCEEQRKIAETVPN
jgi:hypothetical protein